MKARLILHRKRVFDDGAVLELKLWEVPSPVRGSSHSLKYSLFYGKGGVRLVGYDNEAGKGTTDTGAQPKTLTRGGVRAS